MLFACLLVFCFQTNKQTNKQITNQTIEQYNNLNNQTNKQTINQSIKHLVCFALLSFLFPTFPSHPSHSLFLSLCVIWIVCLSDCLFAVIVCCHCFVARVNLSVLPPSGPMASNAVSGIRKLSKLGGQLFLQDVCSVGF